MFCRNCGKDIGDSLFCPDCGTKANENAKVQETVVAPQPQLGKYGETITEDGRKIFNSAKHALDAMSRSSALFKARKVFATIAGIFILAGFIFSVMAMIMPNFLVLTSFIIPLFIVGVVFGLPNLIMGIFVDKKGAKWLKEENVDIKETITRGLASSNDKNFANSLKRYKLIIDKPSNIGFSIATSILSVFIIPYTTIFGGIFLTLLPYQIAMMRGAIEAINLPFVQPVLLGMGMVFLILFIPSAILSNVQLSKAKKNYEQGEQ